MEASEQFKDVHVYTGDKAYQAEPVGGNLVPVAPMMPMMQSKTAYHTAVSVQKPRDLDKVVAAVKREAALAGEAFYWSWPVKVKNKETGKYETKTLSGASIGLSMCVAREWTNVAVPVDYMETATHDIFTAHFVDLERGFTVSRIWKQSKKANKDLDSYGDRAVNMTFQAAQSRAIRNVVLAGVPKWLVEQAKEIAMDSVLKGITPEKIAKAKEAIIKVFGAYGVNEARLVAAVGVPITAWGPEEIVTLKGFNTQIKDGQVTAEELFPAVEEKKEPDKKPTTKPKTPPAAPEAMKSQVSPEVAPSGGTLGPRGITDETQKYILGLAVDKDYPFDMLLADYDVTALSELTEEAGRNIIKFLEEKAD